MRIDPSSYVARFKGATLEVEVKDDGRFLSRQPQKGRGFGLRVIEAIAFRVNIDQTAGTSVRMFFNTGLPYDIA